MLRLLTIALCLVSQAAYAETGKTETVLEQGPVKVGEPLPTFAGWSVDGEMVRFKDILAPVGQKASEATVVSFFATWCVPCAVGLPKIQRVVDESDGRVQGVLIAVGEDAPIVRPYLKKNQYSMLAIMDPHKVLSGRILGASLDIPRTYVIDASGIVRQIYVVEGEDFETHLKQALKEATAAK